MRCKACNAIFILSESLREKATDRMANTVLILHIKHLAEFHCTCGEGMNIFRFMRKKFLG